MPLLGSTAAPALTLLPLLLPPQLLLTLLLTLLLPLSPSALTMGRDLTIASYAPSPSPRREQLSNMNGLANLAAAATPTSTPVPAVVLLFSGTGAEPSTAAGGAASTVL
ncbi:Ff.00g068070.m01.CDS01 [Fusarium sp. VM40]|nr:Ff.00g068070.m01.CDS01 [Fusarium sp. VM40]